MSKGTAFVSGMHLAWVSIMKRLSHMTKKRLFLAC